MNELETLLHEAGLKRALEKSPHIPDLDAKLLQPWLSSRTPDNRLTAEARERIIALAKQRVRGILIDEAFEKAGSGRALEPHARVPIVNTDVLWRMNEGGRGERVFDWARQRHEEITLEERDRYRYGWRGNPDRTREPGGGWKRALDAIDQVKANNPRMIPKILCMGGNGSSKSEFAGWYAVKVMVEKPGAEIAVLCPSQTQARNVMMARIFDNLPAEWKPSETGKSKQGITGSISYTRKMGFTENMFILPNGSRCTFYFYLEGDPKAIEGNELALAIGDEEVPVEWLEACEYRLARTAGTLMAMFTPISGYIPTVSWFRGNGHCVEERASPLLKKIDGQEVPAWFDGPAGAHEEPVMMPLRETGDDATKHVVYFWTEDCCYPAGGYETLVELLKNKRASVNEIKTRAYGFPTKVKEARFPLLSVKVHAISPERALAGEVPKDVTWYHVLDPASGRNHVMQWWAVTRDKREIIVREWPQQDDYIPGVGEPGEWAVDAKKGKALDGVPGPAQEAWGLTTEQYRDEIMRVEKELARLFEKRTDGEPIQVRRRLMDSRGGKAGINGKTYFTEFAKAGIKFVEASGQALNARSDNPDAVCGVGLITDALGYNVERPIGPDNHPRLFVVYAPADTMRGEQAPRGCANTWDSLQNWTGADGLKGARKDFIDLMHYAQRAEMRYRDREKAAAGQKRQVWGGYGAR